MADRGQSTWPALVFADESDTAVLTRAVRRGTLRRLARGIYTSDRASAEADLARTHAFDDAIEAEAAGVRLTLP